MVLNQEYYSIFLAVLVRIKKSEVFLQVSRHQKVIEYMLFALYAYNSQELSVIQINKELYYRRLFHKPLNKPMQG